MKLLKPLFTAAAIACAAVSLYSDPCENKESSTKTLSEPGLAMMKLGLGFASDGDIMGMVILREDDLDITTLSSPDSLHVHIDRCDELMDNGEVRFNRANVPMHNDAYILGAGGEIEVPFIRLKAEALKDGEKPENTRGYILKAYIDDPDANKNQSRAGESGKQKLVYSVKVFGGYKSGPDSSGYIPESEVNNGIYEVVAQRTNYAGDEKNKRITIQKDYVKAGVPADDLWRYDLDGEEAFAKKSMEQITVKNNHAQDTVYDVFSKTVVQGKRITERKSIQYKHYPLSKRMTRSANGDSAVSASLDLDKGVRLKDLPVLERHSVMLDDGSILPIYEEVSSYNLGQGVGEENTRATIKYHKGARGVQKIYEYDDSSVPVRAYILSKRIGLAVKDADELKPEDLVGQEVEVIEYDLDSSKTMHVSETRKRGVMRALPQKMSRSVSLENEVILESKAVKADSVAATSAANVQSEMDGPVVEQLELKSASFRLVSAPNASNPSTPPVFSNAGGGYTGIFRMNITKGGSLTSAALPFGYQYTNAEGFSLDHMKNVIAVEMVNTSTGKTAFTAKYVWDDGSSNGGQSGYRLLNWTYYDYGAYPYDLVGTYNSNGTYSKVEIQRVTGESTHTTTDEYGSVTTTVKDSEGRDKSVTMQAASNDRYDIGQLTVSYEYSENASECSSCPSAYKNTRATKTTYTGRGGANYSTYNKYSSAGFSMINVDEYGRIERKEISPYSVGYYLLKSYVGNSLQSTDQIYYPKWNRSKRKQLAGPGVVPEYANDYTTYDREIEYGYEGSGRFEKETSVTNDFESTTTIETPRGTSVAKFIKLFKGSNEQALIDSDGSSEQVFDRANGVFTSNTSYADGKKTVVTTDTSYEFSDAGVFKTVVTNDSSAPDALKVTTTKTRLSGFGTDEDAWGDAHQVISESVSENSRYKTVSRQILDKAGKTLTSKIARYSKSGGVETVAGKTYDIYFNGKNVERISDTFGSNGQLLSRQRIVYSYDSFGRPTESRIYEGDSLVLTYKNFYGPLTSTTIPGVPGTISSLGRLSATSAIGADGAKSGEIYEYYGNGDYRAGMLKKRTVAEVFSDDGMPVSGSLNTYIDYNPLGKITHIWGNNVTPVKYGYNVFGEITDMWLYAADSSTAANWNAETWPSDETAAQNTHWTYNDALGVVVSKTDAIGKTVSATYDGVGTITAMSYPNGGSESYSYDALKRLSEITFGDNTGYSFSYDSEGNTVSVADESGASSSFAYQGGVTSLPRSETLPDGYVLERTFNPDGNIASVSLKDSDGNTVYSAGYSYDGLGQLSSLSAEGKTVSYSRDASMRITRVDLNGTAYISYSYDGLSRPLSASYCVGSVTLRGNVYNIDGLSRVSKTDVVKNGGVAESWHYSYFADRLGLKGVSVMDGESPRDEYSSEEYEYDMAGNPSNVKSNGILREVHQPNANNQLAGITMQEGAKLPVRGEADAAASLKIFVDGAEQSVSRAAGETAFAHGISYAEQPKYLEIKTEASMSGQKSMSRGALFIPPASESFTYDDAGNLSGDSRWNYTWNARQRLAAIETTAAAVAAGAPREKYEYAYDYRGRKVKAVKYAWNPSEGESGAWAEVYTNRRYYDEWNLIYEKTEFADGRTPVVNKFYYGLDLQESLHDTGGTGGVRLMNLNGTLAYPYNGVTGNIGALFSADADNALLAEYEYAPFGEVWKASGALADRNPLRYSSRYAEANTRLYYYGFRHYSPKMKKWLSKDPISEAGGVNLYGMVNNLPHIRYDVFGLKVEACSIDLEVGHGNNNPNESEIAGRVGDNAQEAANKNLTPHQYKSGGVGCYDANSTSYANVDGHGNYGLNNPDSVNEKRSTGESVFNGIPAAVRAAANDARRDMCRSGTDSEKCCTSVTIYVNLPDLVDNPIKINSLNRLRAALKKFGSNVTFYIDNALPFYNTYIYDCSSDSITPTSPLSWGIY